MANPSSAVDAFNEGGCESASSFSEHQLVKTPADGASRGITQASKLRQNPPKSLGVKKVLSTREDWGEWKFYTQNAARGMSMEDLLDDSIKRPEKNDNAYDNWETQSRILASWLVLQLGKDIIEEYRFLPSVPLYADEAFRSIKEILFGRSHTYALMVWERAVHMERSSYGTIGEFVTNFRRAVCHSNEIVYKFPYPCACLHVIYELRKELPAWATFTEDQFPPDAVTSQKEEDFLKICVKAIEQGNILSMQGGIQNASSSTKKKGKREADS